MNNNPSFPESDNPHVNSSNSEKIETNQISADINEELSRLNVILLSSLPYPAMYVRCSNRTVLAANNLAINLGAKVGGHCWRDFTKSSFLSPEDKQTADKQSDSGQEVVHIKCAFCRGDECILENPSQNKPEINAFGKIWDTFWIKVSDDVFLHYLIDITERKLLEESLRESEQFLKQTQQIAQIGTFNLDLLTMQWTSSKVLDSIFGIEHVTLRTFEDWTFCIVPEMRKAITDYFTTEVIGKKNKFDKEYKIIRHDNGEERWVHGIGDLKLDEKGIPIRLIGTIQDITQRKQEQSQINRNLKFTEALLKSIPTPVFFTDKTAHYTGCNEAFTSQLGFTNNEVKGKSVLDLWPNELSEKYFKSDLELLVNQDSQVYETKISDKNHITRDVIFAKNVFFDEIGNVAGIVGTYIDITKQKQVETELRKSELMLLTVLDHFPGVVFWKDTNSVYMGCNKAFASAAGLKNPTEIVGKTDFDLPWAETEALNYRTDDREVMEKEIDKLHIIETQHQADGKIIWYDTSKIPLRDSATNVIGVIGVSNDITDRKLAIDALKRSEEKYRTIANFTNDWEYWLDLNDNFVYCSPSCVKITGYKAENFIHNPNLFLQIIHPDDLEKYLQHRIERFTHQSSSEFQFRIITNDGEIRWIGHISQQVFNESGECIGIRGSNRDITERKKTEQQIKNSERKYKLLSKNINDGVFTCRNGIIEYVNYSMSRIFGYEESELEGMKISQLIVPEHRDDFEIFISVEPTKNQTNNTDIECKRKDNSTVFVEIFTNYVASEGLLYGVIHDITEKKQIQEKNIIKAIIQTEEKERAHFSKELHDGLGPLLSTIKLYLQWSLRPKSNRSRKEIIMKAEEVLEEALTAVKEISNKLSPHLLTNYGLSSAVQSFVNKLEETHTIKIEFQSNLSRRIEMEIEVALYRAIIECVNNTIKYAKARHIYLKINDTGNHIQLQYRDDGKGFDIVKILLEKKGLGLFNLQNRIQTIGGEIKMFSKQREGVNYQINIPVK